MNLKLIDTHCHLPFRDFDEDRKGVIGRALDEGIGMISVGASWEESQEAVKIAEKHDGIWACVGLHPEEADQKFDINKLKELAKHPKVVGIGECGLDYFHNNKNKEEQKKLFKKQIELSLELDRPLMIHARDSHGDVLEILENYKNIEAELQCNIHCFTGNFKEAKKYLSLGFYISFTGIITFTKDYDDMIRNIPLEKIMVETDAPLIAPVPHRGKRNEPAYVKEVARRLADIKGVSFDEVAKTTTQTAIDFFGLK